MCLFRSLVFVPSRNNCAESTAIAGKIKKKPEILNSEMLEIPVANEHQQKSANNCQQSLDCASLRLYDSGVSKGGFARGGEIILSSSPCENL